MEFVVQHEFDNEPTFIVNKDDESQCIEISAAIPWQKRLQVAHEIARLLNS